MHLGKVVVTKIQNHSRFDSHPMVRLVGLKSFILIPFWNTTLVGISCNQFSISSPLGLLSIVCIKVRFSNLYSYKISFIIKYSIFITHFQDFLIFYEKMWSASHFFLIFFLILRKICVDYKQNPVFEQFSPIPQKYPVYIYNINTLENQTFIYTIYNKQRGRLWALNYYKQK
jgi:hypothetical protein